MAATYVGKLLNNQLCGYMWGVVGYPVVSIQMIAYRQIFQLPRWKFCQVLYMAGVV